MIYANQVLFYLWQIRPVPNHSKVLKYYDQDCLKIFHLFSTLPMMIQVSSFYLKKASSIK